MDRPDDADDAPPPPDLFAHEAADLAEFWTEYPLNFTPESLRHLDSLVAEHWPAGPDDDTAEGVRRGMVIQFGSYFGETLVRNRDGEWTELDPGTWAVVVRGEAGEATVDPFRVARDCLDGSGRFRSLYESVTGGI